MDPLRRQCAGTTPRPFSDFPAGYWFTPKGAKGLSVTYCAFCVERLQLGVELLVVAHAPGGITCDANGISEDYYRTRKGPFSVELMQPKLGVRHLLVPSERVKAKEGGVGIYALPTQSDYAVTISLDQPPSFGAFGSSSSSECFTVESFTVGERKVKPFSSDGKVYCTRPLTVRGFTPGSTDSFRFVSVSEGEKQRKEVDAAVLANYNEDNVIHIVLQRHTRQAVPTFNAMPYGMSRGGGAGFTSFGGDSFGMQKLGGSASFKHQPVDADLCWGGGGGAPLSGGTTVSGGRAVTQEATRPTSDTFAPRGDPIELVMQLACFQPPRIKEDDNKRAALHEAGYDYFMHQCIQLEKERVDLMRRIKLAEEHVTPLRMSMLTIDGRLPPLIDPEEKTATVQRLLLEDTRREQDAQMLPLQ